MKFTKKEIRDIKDFFSRIQSRLEINKVYENKNPIPEFIKINLIKYGIYAGRVIEIIHRRIDFKNEEKNLNADELIKELFGKDFFDWICKKNNRFIYGDDKNNNVNNTIDNITNN